LIVKNQNKSLAVELSTLSVIPATEYAPDSPEMNLQRLESKIIGLLSAYRESEKQRLQLAEEVSSLRTAISDMQETSRRAAQTAALLTDKLVDALTTDDLTTEELKEWLDQYIRKIDHALVFLKSQLPKNE
jgi:small-conductance mechanosensitive channel